MRFIFKSTTHLLLRFALNLNLMKKNSLTLSTFYIFFIICSIALLNSCTPVKKVVYFENLQKDSVIHTFVNNNYELKIRKNDLLYIGIISSDPASTSLFNAVQGTAATTSNNNGPITSGYLVDDKGDIILYKLGALHVEGLTRNELKNLLQKELLPYLKDVVVTVRFLSNRVTILGEVGKPQVLNMPNEQISLLEAIGQSGDLNFTGRRDNILVIRETPQGKQFKRLNLTDNSIFYSPFYYLKPDDIVYVEPTKYKINNAGQTQQIISYVLSGISILITVLVYLIPRN
ncbi:MAG: sugar transporter [Chitinophagaceae bacterium]|nr:sugar transporter [Chitinophagaceae bacterium]